LTPAAAARTNLPAIGGGAGRGGGGGGTVGGRRSAREPGPRSHRHLDGLSARRSKGDRASTSLLGCGARPRESRRQHGEESLRHPLTTRLARAGAVWKTVAGGRGQAARARTAAAHESARAVARAPERSVARRRSEVGDRGAYPAAHIYLYRWTLRQTSSCWHGRASTRPRTVIGIRRRQPPAGDKRFAPGQRAAAARSRAGAC